jgi:hypothetical protein
MGYLETKMTPKHLDRIQPGTVSGQIKQHQTPGCSTHNIFNLTILVRVGIIPGNINDFLRMLFQQGNLQFSHFLTSLSFANNHYDFSRMIVHSTQAIMNFRLTWGRDGVGIITYCPLGLHIFRKVGSHLTMNSSA